jgi:hypothetical protein
MLLGIGLFLSISSRRDVRRKLEKKLMKAESSSFQATG